ncbi:alpha/beta hydrolase [Yoonia vestfoldensis]|jgi:acetyl esterase/lipase|uniref:Esterase n=1 Tax=Yoonia vestfoldensis TaxID=245188 RepID=A0A1Y0EEV6_9RHOB|nr:alpha/beta hydrolase [Yoonia vestfoldensis]ARU01969.1 esterase [Yoonia vestfoldensis]
MDLDDAYANAAHIPGGADYPDRWAAQAAAFRSIARCELDLDYGETDRLRFDLFHPDRLARGVVIFVHGGYWLRFDKSFWSHLAAGPLAQGWAVAMPSYDLCPKVGIAQIGAQIQRAIDVIARRVPGPVRLVGHSAGAQLVARAMAPRPEAAWQQRVASVVPVSPVADLAPLMRTSMNAQLQITPAIAQTESPVHLPAPSCPATIWVGGAERPVFLAQAALLAQVWAAPLVREPGRHHFDVIEALALPDSDLTRAVLA